MKTSDFSFDLPPRLIAQYPAVRGQSRLMVLDRRTGRRRHRRVSELPSLLKRGDLLVFNDSRVRKARLFAVSAATGGAVEFLLLKQIDPRIWQTMVRGSRRRRPGSRYLFRDETEAPIAEAVVFGGEGEFRTLCFDRPIDDQWLDRYGHLPLPPYIKRQDDPADGERYQTVYAAETGSAAAPTAGLHFTRELLAGLEAAGVETAFITLHVGLGTFLPVRSEHLEDHTMHEERYRVDEDSARRITAAKTEGRRVIAVGTTSVRTLESAWDGDRLRAGEGTTAIFLYPGCSFGVVDALFTNFHTPESTLLMLTAAFAEAAPPPSAAAPPPPAVLSGRELILESYAEAVKEGYRFFSYGDAMLIE
ncbi:MAG: tRNA preQ1(34) S-adenosylmethionine ribosyltransferase-isomerase QueA [Treponema sp.]|jgi:S-adenosylmethionine:tRNA ribosyltransferase-isomerase|nr:tRNA preQ1(34) S-adenosylmethionine ribosyltransferase-isomerase QueA [Treponema sp.]